MSAVEFRRAFLAATGLRRIYNFYGMVEQVGSVFSRAKRLALTLRTSPTSSSATVLRSRNCPSDKPA